MGCCRASAWLNAAEWLLPMECSKESVLNCMFQRECFKVNASDYVQQCPASSWATTTTSLTWSNNEGKQSGARRLCVNIMGKWFWNQFQADRWGDNMCWLVMCETSQHTVPSTTWWDLEAPFSQEQIRLACHHYAIVPSSKLICRCYRRPFDHFMPRQRDERWTTLQHKQQDWHFS